MINTTRRVLREEDFPFPTEAQMKREIENDLRRICREEGCERIGVILARERQAERREALKLAGLPEDDDKSWLDKPLGPVKQPKAVKPPKPEKPKKPSVPDGYVTISVWAAEWKLTPMEARAMLRASDLEKPAYGWAFDPKNKNKIKKICGVK